MTKLVDYNGDADVKTVTAADFAALGISHSTVTFTKENNYVQTTSDAAAAALLAMSPDFTAVDGSSFLDIFENSETTAEPAVTSVTYDGTGPKQGAVVIPRDSAAGTSALRKLGTTGTTAAAGNDPRIVGAVQKSDTARSIYVVDDAGVQAVVTAEQNEDDEWENASFGIDSDGTFRFFSFADLKAALDLLEEQPPNGGSLAYDSGAPANIPGLLYNNTDDLFEAVAENPGVRIIVLSTMEIGSSYDLNRCTLVGGLPGMIVEVLCTGGMLTNPGSLVAERNIRFRGSPGDSLPLIHVMSSNGGGEAHFYVGPGVEFVGSDIGPTLWVTSQDDDDTFLHLMNSKLLKRSDIGLVDDFSAVKLRLASGAGTVHLALHEGTVVTDNTIESDLPEADSIIDVYSPSYEFDMTQLDPLTFILHMNEAFTPTAAGTTFDPTGEAGVLAGITDVQAALAALAAAIDAP